MGAGQLDGKVAVITGRGQPRLDAAISEIGRSVTGVPGDAAVLADLDRLYAVIAAQRRGIDVLVANAGGGGPAGIADITPEQFDATAALTFRGTYFTVQRALPLLNDGAAIVLIASIAAGNGTARHGIYNASKAAVRSLARTLTLELKGRGIRVNALSPGPTDTQGFASFAGERGEEFRAQLATVIPVVRIGRPEEVASAALFLASAESSFIAGAELVVDGGMSQV
jgi:NAD(P)-dependent dehydrogenase (short-subunit alcohol dehydrogenase family)